MSNEVFILGANMRDVDRPQVTAGISRNMQRNLPAVIAQLGPDPQAAQGGGDLNGSSATSILFGKSGTNGQRWQLIRTPRAGSGNYCGTV
jgi:hypothetical protein